MIGYKNYFNIEDGDVIVNGEKRLVILSKEPLGNGKGRYVVKTLNGQRYSFDESLETLLPIELILAPIPRS